MKRKLFIFGAIAILGIGGMLGMGLDKPAKNGEVSAAEIESIEFQCDATSVQGWAFDDKNFDAKFFSGNIPGINATDKKVVSFQSKQELKSFTSSMIKKYKTQNGDSKLKTKNSMNFTKKLEARKEYKQFMSRYNDKFFQTRNLVVAIVEKAPACAKYSVKNLDVKENTLVVRLTKQCPNPGNEKLNWVMVLEIDKNDYKYNDVKVIVQ